MPAKPVTSTKSSGPKRVSATTSRSPAQSQSGSPVVIAPESYAPTQPHLLDPRESILLCGDSFAGKSFAWAMIAQRLYDEDAEKPADKRRKVFVIDTDNTTAKFLGPGYEFAHLYYQNGGNVYPFPATNYDESAGAVSYIMKNHKQNDWVAVDVVSRWNDQTRQFIGARKGIVVEDARVERGIRGLGFGEFDPNTWNLVNITHDTLLGRLVYSCKANLLLLTHITDYVDTRENREVMVLFDQVGVKPEGRKTIYKLVDTVIFIWSQRFIQRDERNRRRSTGHYTRRRLSVVKDRGEPYNISEDYDKFFLDKLQEIRASGVRPENVVGDEAIKALGLEEEGPIGTPQPDLTSVEDLTTAS
jgi:hypothetical protein